MTQPTAYFVPHATPRAQACGQERSILGLQRYCRLIDLPPTHATAYFETALKCLAQRTDFGGVTRSSTARKPARKA